MPECEYGNAVRELPKPAVQEPASAVALIAHGRAQKGDKIQIQMDGGTLTIEWNPTDNHVYMTGNAVTVFEGSIKL